MVFAVNVRVAMVGILTFMLAAREGSHDACAIAGKSSHRRAACPENILRLKASTSSQGDRQQNNFAIRSTASAPTVPAIDWGLVPQGSTRGVSHGGAFTS